MGLTRDVSIAANVPFDVLCHIFDYYAQAETLDHPLETLLLVCKSWSNAARDNSHLWSKISIVFQDLVDLKKWNSLVPRRLGRCPPDVLFDIQIMDTGDGSRGYLQELRHVVVYDKILLSLVGRNGELARRWRTFKASSELNHKCEMRGHLSHPTPNLEELEVTGLFPTGNPLPYTPLLKRFHSPSRFPTAFPDLSTVEDLGFDHAYVTEASSAGATKVVKLTTYNATNALYRVPGTFPSVTHLNLSWPGGQDEDGVGRLGLPALKHLTLCVRSVDDFYWLLNCKGLPLNQVEQAVITSRSPLFDVDEDEIMTDGLYALLKEMTGLKGLEVNGPVIPLMAVRVLSEESELLPGLLLKVKVDGQEMELHKEGKKGASTEVEACTPTTDKDWLNNCHSAINRNWTDVYNELWSMQDNVARS